MIQSNLFATCSQNTRMVWGFPVETLFGGGGGGGGLAEKSMHAGEGTR